MRYFVVPDLHGRYALAKGLLEEAGIVDHQGVRVREDDVRTVQLGDLADCTPADRDGDLKLLRKARAWFDVLLVGNHEYPYFGGGGFRGFVPLAEVEQAVRNLFWLPAYPIGGTLLTHAGVVPELGLRGTASEAAEELVAVWRMNPRHSPFFRQVGRARGGYAPFGGVLWSDWRAESRDDRFDQVHGHTALGEEGPAIFHSESGRFAINLDCGGGRLAGVWLDERGQPGDFVEFGE